MRTDRRQDAEMDRLLRAALEGAAGRTTEGCPAPDELGAYLEHGLSRQEVRSLERHFAECDRCQQVLASLADMPGDSDETVSAAGWWANRSWRRWLVPAAAAAGALVLYVALKPEFGAESTARKPFQPRATIAQQLPSTPSPAIGAPASIAATPLREEAPSPAASPSSPARHDAPDRAALRSRPAPPAAVSAPAALPQASLEFTRTAARADREPAKEERTAKQAPTAASEGRGLGAVAGDAANKPAAQPTKLAAEAPPAAPAAPPKTEYLTMVGAARATDTRQASTAAPVVPIVVPARTGEATRWRLDANGGISRSTDAGGSWQVQRQPGGSALLAGVAPSTNVCWAVGSAGTVLLTTDGTRWRPRPFPERVELVGVTADDPDGLRATVRTRDGRRFSTADGGATWVLR